MAREVPYNPVPDQKPIEGTGAREVAVSANADMFGAQVASAVKGLGGSIDHVGNELFNRAIAIQELQNETEARKADSDYMIKAGQLHADFNALEGEARVKAFPEHMKALQQTRENIRGGLSNDMARKMYDSQSLSTMGRTIFNAAGAAASAQRQWSVNTLKAQSDLDAQEVEDNPKDDINFQRKLGRANENAKQLGTLQTGSDRGPIIDDLQMRARSGLWKRRLIGLGRTEPFEAREMLDKNKTNLTEDDYLRVDTAITSTAHAVGAARIANDVYNNNPEMTLRDLEVVARNKAEKLLPKDEVFQNKTVATLQGLFNQRKYATAQEDQANLDTVRGGYEKGVKDLQQLLSDPKVADAYNNLSPKYREMVPGMINRFNAARDKVSHEDTKLQVNGMALNDREGFLSLDVTKLPLNTNDMISFQKLQAKMKTDQNADPRVNRAFVQIRGAYGQELEALGIYKRTDSNKDDYDKFTGALQSALDNWQQTHSKPADYQQTLDIGKQLMRTHAEPGMIWGTNQVPFFKMSLPTDVAGKQILQKVKDDVTLLTGQEPTEEELYKAYVRQQYIQLYGSKKDQASAPKPKVPTSQ